MDIRRNGRRASRHPSISSTMACHPRIQRAPGLVGYERLPFVQRDDELTRQRTVDRRRGERDELRHLVGTGARSRPLRQGVPCGGTPGEGEGLRVLRPAAYFITQAVNSDIDTATVSRIAGHATVAFTLQVYFHPPEETAAPLAASVEATLGSSLSAL
jgi:hypothetical protein